MADINELSERELEILKLVATGASNKEIAQKLYISSNTVKVHLRNIFAKIGVTTRTEAAMHAVRIGQAGGEFAAEPAPPVSVDAPVQAKEQIPTNRLVLRFGFFIALLVVLVGIAAFVRLSNRPAVIQTIEPTVASQVTAIADNRWQVHASMRTARSGFGAVAYDNNIYVIAGATEAGITGSVERYDPAADTWTEATAKPVPVRDAPAVVIGGKIYLPGGLLPGGEVTDVLEIYDIQADQWTVGASLPRASSGTAIAAFEGRLYLFGGWDGAQYLALAYAYDPIQDQWQELPPLPTVRAFAAAAVASERIYVLGGRNAQGDLAVNEVFSPAAGTEESPWTSGVPMPLPRSGMGVASVANIIHVVGGASPGVENPPSFFYIPSTNTWTTLNRSLDRPVSNLGLVSLEATIYAIGGEDQDTVMDNNQSYPALFVLSIPIIR